MATATTTYNDYNINNTAATADGNNQQLLTGSQTAAVHTDTVNNKNITTSSLVGLVSGCAGAVALVYVGQPLDTIKVRMQLATATVTTSSGCGVSMWSCVRNMWRQALVAPAASRLNNATAIVGETGGGSGHGVVEACSLSSTTITARQWTNKVAVTGRMVRLMYAGTAPALLANVAENGVLFAAYGPCQRLVAFVMDLFNGGGGGVVDDARKKLGPATMAMAGSLASLCSAFALCPTELIKIRLQAADLERCNAEVNMRDAMAGQRRAPPAHATAGSTLQVVARVWTTEGGLRGMYRGLGSTVVREMPGYYVFFLAYEASRNYLNARISKTTTIVVDGSGAARGEGYGAAANQEDPTWVTMTAGAAAGTCLWLAVYPVDAIKSRVQAWDNSSGSFLKSFALTVRNEGPLALYRGLAPTMIRTVPASAVMFWAVERTKTLLTGYGL